MLYDNFDFDFLSDDGDVIRWENTITQDNVPVISENYFKRLHGNGGWSDKRNMRHIAQVPAVAWIAAEKEGWNLRDRNEMYRYLQLHPDFCTANLKSAVKDAHIIIK